MQTRCRYSYCIEIIEPGQRFCKEHLPLAQEKYEAYSALYYQQRNIHDAEYRKFYSSAEWRKCAMEVKKQFPICQECFKAFSYAVHHIEPLKNNWGRRLDKSNLMALCQSCHSKIELSERSNKGN